MARRAGLDYHVPVVGGQLIANARAAALVLGVIAGTLVPGPVRAAERTFMDVSIEPYRGSYLVTAAVNLRAAPTADSEKLGLFEEDQIIEVVGRVKDGEWVAVIENGRPAGFVYGGAVLPLIDGHLSGPLRGVAEAAEGPPCRYEIRFMDRSQVEGQSARIADYIAELRCGTGDAGFRLPAPMFLTETPYDVGRRDRVFQINVDLLADTLGKTEFEFVFSTVFLFDLDTGTVKYDSATEDAFVRGDLGDLARPATDPSAALRAALEMALDVWSEELWKAAKANAG